MLSIIVPVYNQERNLQILFNAFDAYQKEEREFPLELILVNDGSTDTSLQRLHDFRKGREEIVRVVSYVPNKGRGYAVRKGLISATGDWRVVMDADLAASFSEIKKTISCMHQGYDVVIGSRRIAGAIVKTAPSPLRWFLGMGFIFLARVITGVPVSDFSCGFKAYSKKAVDVICPYTKIERWGHDAENLYLAKQKGLAIGEVPLLWNNGTETKVRVLRDVIGTFLELIQIRILHP